MVGKLFINIKHFHYINFIFNISKNIYFLVYNTYINDKVKVIIYQIKTILFRANFN